MRSSPLKDFGVFDFKVEDGSVESVPGSLMGKLRNLKRESCSVSENQFLECFSREADTQQMQITNAPCVAVDKNCNHSEVKEGISKLDETLNEPTAVISDEDESVKTSCPSTSSDLEENEGSLADPACNPHSLGWEMENINVAVVVSPDYIIYGDNYCTESQLTFCSSCIMLEGSNAYGSKEFFSSEWAIIDVTHIESQWCGMLETAFVKLCITPNAATGAENSYGDIVELKFAVYDCHWPEEQKRIMLLNERYKAIWRAVFDTELAREEVDDVGQNNMFSSNRYFSNFDKHFEDVVYPKGDPDAVSISKRDIELLQPETFINDTLIDFYIKYLKNRIQPEDRPRFHFFNSFFFRKLADLDKNPSSAFEGSTAFPRVRKWTRKVNLLEKDYIFIPVNFNLHWSLIVICHLGEVANSKDEELKMLPKVPCILHMDSIKGSHKGLKNLVQSYLWEEWKARQQAESSEDVSSKFLNLRFVSLELPQQENSFDCGLFLLHYVERFLEVAPVNFNPFKITKFSNFLNTDWFPPAEASLKRSLIQKLIQELLEDCAPEIPPAACNDVHDSYAFPENDKEKEDGLVFLSERCSRVKISGSTSSAVDQGIETEVSATSPLDGAVRDQGFVFRQLFQPGITAEAEFFHERQCQLFDQSHQTTPFHRLKFAMSPIEEDVEAEQRFAYTRSGAPGSSWPSDGAVEACTTSYSSKDNRVLEPLCNPKLEFFMRLEENINADSSPQRSSFGSQNSCDVGVDEQTPIRDFASTIQQEEIENPRLDSPENIGFVRETSASSSSEEPETFTIEDSQEIDRTAEFKENGDPLSFRENSPAMLQGEFGSIETRNLVGDHLQLSGDESTLELDDEKTAKLPILVPLLADDNTAKRPILMPLLDEEQTVKRPRLMPSIEEEKEVVHERHGEGLSLLSTGCDIIVYSLVTMSGFGDGFYFDDTIGDNDTDAWLCDVYDFDEIGHDLGYDNIDREEDEVEEVAELGENDLSFTHFPNITHPFAVFIMGEIFANKHFVL